MNYHRIIYHLINLKKEFRRVKEEKYQGLIDELSKYKFEPNSDNDYIPNNKDLAKIFNCSQNKMNSLIKDFLAELIGSLRGDPPLRINKFVHKIYISIPFDEEFRMNREQRERNREEYTWIEMVLPVTPQIGDEIEIPFIEETGRNYRGYVHNIKHTITGTTQEVLIEVHPWRDFYYKWVKMKDYYERMQKL